MLKILRTFIIYTLFILLTGCADFFKKSEDLYHTMYSSITSFSLKPPAITTSFSDVNTSKVSIGKAKLKKSKKLCSMPRNNDGSYILSAGYYEITVKSFCLMAGTHGPSQGDGYLYAPLKGDKSELIKRILTNMEYYPNIAQHDVQLLLWAIISQTEFKNLSIELQGIALQLLGNEGILEFSGGVLGIIPDTVMAQLTSHLPPSLKKIAEVENKMRSLFSKAGSTYADIERLAVLSGAAVIDHPEYERGVWSKHIGGYSVRYLPSGYSKVKIEVYIPKELGTVIFNAVSDVAMPANTDAQRLGLSNIPVNQKGCK